MAKYGLRTERESGTFGLRTRKEAEKAPVAPPVTQIRTRPQIEA